MKVQVNLRNITHVLHETYCKTSTVLLRTQLSENMSKKLFSMQKPLPLRYYFEVIIQGMILHLQNGTETIFHQHYFNKINSKCESNTN
jgi:hypothetical protein